MKKWEKEILQKQIKSEQAVIYRLRDSYKFALEAVNEKIQVLMAKDQTQSVIYQLRYQQNLQKQLENIYSQMSQNWYSDIDSYLKDCYEDSFYSTMYGIQQDGIPAVIPFNQKEMAQMAAQSDFSGIQLSQRLYNDSVEAARVARQEITRGIAMNSSYADITRAVAKRGEPTLNQAFRIVRTESHRIHEEVKFQTIDKVKNETGADIVKQWDSSIDKRTRPSHAALDGQLREIEQPFKCPLNGHTAMYPGGFGIASEDINCRCVMLQRARWALDQSELEKAVGNLDGMSDDELEELAKKFGISKEELIKKSNGVIESDGSINHRIKASNYNQFKKKYQSKVKLVQAQKDGQTEIAKLEIDAKKSEIEQLKKIASGQALEEYKAQLAAQYQTDPMFLMSKMTDEEKKVWQSLSPYGAQEKIDELQKQIKSIEDAIKNPQIPVEAVNVDHSALMENAKRFSNSQAADRYHTANNFVQDRWDNDLTASERKGVITYTTNAYEDINRNLRAGTPQKSEYASQIKNITRALEKTQLAEDTVVYRGMGGADALSAWTGIPIDQLKDSSVQQSLVGKTLTEKAFMSTGTTASSAWSGIRLEVYLPKGTQAMYVDPISAYRGEYEILVQRNSTFDVIRVDADENGYITNIVLALVKQAH